jgi:dienelactone hydrolase
LNSVKTYLSYPRNNKTDNAILFLTDIYGIPNDENKVLGDSLAAAGYLVVMPDIMANDIPNEKTSIFEYLTWFPKHNVTVADNIIDKTVKYMRGEMGVKKIGAVGYCFGGRYGARVMQEGKGVDAAFIAHPTLLEKAELEAVAGPLSIAAAGMKSQSRSILSLPGYKLISMGYIQKPICNSAWPSDAKPRTSWERRRSHIR